MMPPRTARARAALVSAEQSLSGLAAGLTLAACVTTAMHGAPAAAILRTPMDLAFVLSLAGVACSCAARLWRWGLDHPPASRFGATWPLSFGTACVLCACLGALLAGGAFSAPVAIRHDAPPPPDLALLWGAALPALTLLGLLALRGVAATEQAACPVVPDLAQPIAHALLGGMALLMGGGLVTGQITAELTYHMGAAVTVASAATVVWTALAMRAARRHLRDERAQGRGWPLAERGYLTVSLATLLGLVLPSLVILADLLTARLSGMVVACATVAVSSHAVRFGWVLLRCGTNRRAA